jgi:hypothetical protein
MKRRELIAVSPCCLTTHFPRSRPSLLRVLCNDFREFCVPGQLKQSFACLSSRVPAKHRCWACRQLWRGCGNCGRCYTFSEARSPQEKSSVYWFQAFTVICCSVNSVLACLKCVDVGTVVNVSEIYAASIFRVYSEDGGSPAPIHTVLTPKSFAFNKITDRTMFGSHCMLKIESSNYDVMIYVTMWWWHNLEDVLDLLQSLSKPKQLVRPLVCQLVLSLRLRNGFWWNLISELCTEMC